MSKNQQSEYTKQTMSLAQLAKHKETFVKAYVLGWYHNGQMLGQYLWDVPIESYNGDLSLIKEIAEQQYDKLYVTSGVQS